LQNEEKCFKKNSATPPARPTKASLAGTKKAHHGLLCYGLFPYPFLATGHFSLLFICSIVLSKKNLFAPSAAANLHQVNAEKINKMPIRFSSLKN
jgi:hypothetical protein